MILSLPVQFYMEVPQTKHDSHHRIMAAMLRADIIVVKVHIV